MASRPFTAEDVLEHLTTIRNLCDTPYWTASRMARIRELADTAIKHFPSTLVEKTDTSAVSEVTPRAGEQSTTRDASATLNSDAS